MHSHSRILVGKARTEPEELDEFVGLGREEAERGEQGWWVGDQEAVGTDRIREKQKTKVKLHIGT